MMNDDDMIEWTAPEPLEPGEVLPGVQAETFTVPDVEHTLADGTVGRLCENENGLYLEYSAEGSGAIENLSRCPETAAMADQWGSGEMRSFTEQLQANELLQTNYAG